MKNETSCGVETGSDGVCQLELGVVDSSFDTFFWMVDACGRNSFFMVGAKRSRTAPAQDDREVMYTLEETIDLCALGDLLPLMALPTQVSIDANALYSAHKQAKKHQKGFITVKYYKGKHFEKLPTGRVYAYPSLQTLKGTLARICSHTLYVDLDIRKCAPACLLHVARKSFGKHLSRLNAYYQDTDGFLDVVRGESQNVNYIELPDKTFKEAINSLIHGGSYEKKFEEAGVPTGPIPSLEDIKNEVITLRDMCIAHPDFEKMWDACADRPNRRATFTSLLWQHVESQAISKLVEFFSCAGFKPGVLKHDGLMIHWPSLDPFPVDMLRDAEAFLRIELDLNIDLVQKPLTPTPSDREFLRGRKHLHLLPNDTSRAIHCILQHACHRKLHRVQNTAGIVEVYAPHETIPCVLTRYCSCPDFANEVLTQDMPTSTMANKGPVEWLQTTSNEMFPLHSKDDFDKHRVAFINGYLLLEKPLRFCAWQGDETFVTQHFLERRLDGWDETLGVFDLPATPLWDSMIDYQLAGTSEDGEVDRSQSDWLEAFIGRLNFRVNELDNWQVRPLSSVRRERRTFNPLVVGSNPTVGTIFLCVLV